MLSSVGLATARRVRVIGVRSVFSTVARTTASSKIPMSSRIAAVFNRGFAAAASRSATRTATATTTKKTTATKQPAAKKTTAAGQKKATTTKKATAKKAASKKAAPKKTGRPKKVVKEVPENVQLFRKVKELKAQGLIHEQPALLPATSWMVYRLKHGKDVPAASAIETSRVLKERFAALSSVEKQALQDEAHANKLRNDATLISWVATYPVETIEAANRARSKLRKLGKASRSSLKDPRRPKGVATAFSQYVSQRMASGDFEGVPVTTKMSAVASEWKKMSEADRKPFMELFLADQERYRAERASLSPSP